MSLPDWKLPAGVSRSLWEFAHDSTIPQGEAQHLAASPLLEFDRQCVRRWFNRPGRVLDLGCGTARMAAGLTGAGWSYVGVDLSLASLTTARARSATATFETVFVRGNVCELGCFRTDSFEYALLLFGTLGMVSGAENRLHLLKEARRLLKSGGRLALHAHSVWRHFDSPGGRRWLAADLVRRVACRPAAGDTARDYRGIPGMYHHVFTYGELRRLLQTARFAVRESIPLRAEPPRTAVPDLTCRGPFANLRATGWLVLAEAS